MSSVADDSQISLKKCRRHPLAAFELYFARCCAVNWTGTFASESKVMCSVYLTLKTDVFIFRIPEHQSVCQGFFATEKI